MQYILVVEDDFDLNQAICYFLKKSGYGVYGVTFMEKGKQIFFENQIDMVLLDVNLPDGEGFSFCQWVKKQREVPVIYLTARDMEEDALAGYESGAEDYVTKQDVAGYSDEAYGETGILYGHLTTTSIDNWPYKEIRNINIIPGKEGAAVRAVGQAMKKKSLSSCATSLTSAATRFP